MKNALLISSLLLLGASANAQTNKCANVSVGIEAGANMTNMTHDGVNIDMSSTSKEQYDYKPGAKAGALVNINFKQRIDLRTGIYYSAKGATNVKFTHPLDESGNGLRGQLKLNYLEMPLNTFVHVGKSRNFYLGGGGYIAYAASGSYQLNNSAKANKLNFEDSKMMGYAPTNFERLDYGLQAAIGYRVVKGLFIQAQASKGLANVANDANYIKPYNYKNWGFSFTAGWLFGK